MLGSIRSGLMPSQCNTGSAFHMRTASRQPTQKPSQIDWRSSGPIALTWPAPKCLATLAVVASKMPLISRKNGNQNELPMATAARSPGLTRPAIMVSTKPMQVLASWPMKIGRASADRRRHSALVRESRLGFMRLLLVAAGNNFSVTPQQPLSWLIQVPVFVIGQWFGGDDGNNILVGGNCLEINTKVSVFQACRAEGCASGDMCQLAAAVAEQVFSVAKQAVEYPEALILLAGSDQIRQQLLPVNRLRMTVANAVEHVAKSRFAVGVAYRAVVAVFGRKIGKLSVVGKTPVAAPQLAHKGVGIGQLDRADIGLADMADDQGAFDWVTLYQAGNLGIHTWFWVVKQAQSGALIEADTPAVSMWPGTAAALHQAGKTEYNISRHIGTHAKQFTHEAVLLADFDTAAAAQQVAGSLFPEKLLLLLVAQGAGAIAEHFAFEAHLAEQIDCVAAALAVVTVANVFRCLVQQAGLQAQHIQRHVDGAIGVRLFVFVQAAHVKPLCLLQLNLLQGLIVAVFVNYRLLQQINKVLARQLQDLPVAQHVHIGVARLVAEQGVLAKAGCRSQFGQNFQVAILLAADLDPSLMYKVAAIANCALLNDAVAGRQIQRDQALQHFVDVLCRYPAKQRVGQQLFQPVDVKTLGFQLLQDILHHLFPVQLRLQQVAFDAQYQRVAQRYCFVLARLAGGEIGRASCRE